jgi:prevent-host-death family protein
MTIVNIQEAKAQLSQILDRVLNGEEILIAKSGKPVVRLLPVNDRSPRVPGIARGKVTEAFFEPLPEEELKARGQ